MEALSSLTADDCLRTGDTCNWVSSMNIVKGISLLHWNGTGTKYDHVIDS